MGWLSKLFGRKSKEDESVNVGPQPLQFNEPNAQRNRNALRILRLQKAIAESTDPAQKASLKDELERRQKWGK